MVTPAWPLPGGCVINPYNTLLPPLSLLQPLFQDGALLAALPCRGWGLSAPPKPPLGLSSVGGHKVGGSCVLGER